MRSELQSAPVLEGDVLAGKYRVERVLGAGGMGVVVAARHLQLDQLVALKFVLPSALDEASAAERFLREARAAVRLKSEHVAKVLDVGTLDTGAPYMVMEYLEGDTLAEVIQRDSPLPVDVACDYMIQACEAMAEAHSLGIIHRDIKPQNLFLTKGVGGKPLVKVLDFGISKMKQPEGAMNLTQTATVMGSPLYMAPEQMRSARNVDGRSDIWALGVVLYELPDQIAPFLRGVDDGARDQDRAGPDHTAGAAPVGPAGGARRRRVPLPREGPGESLPGHGRAGRGARAVRAGGVARDRGPRPEGGERASEDAGNGGERHASLRGARRPR